MSLRFALGRLIEWFLTLRPEGQALILEPAARRQTRAPSQLICGRLVAARSVRRPAPAPSMDGTG